MRRSRVALIFPPQWDPRQPPLCIPSMAGALRKHGHSVKAWDINLHVYRQLLSTGQLAQKTKKLLEDYLSPKILGDAKEFSKLSSSLEDVIYFGYDRKGEERLYWDSLENALSPDRSRDWQAAATNFKSLPFYGKSTETLIEITRWNPNIIGISAVSDTQVIAAIAI